MSHWDWAIIALLNIPVIVYGFYLGLKVRSSTDWFLAGRTLPWWLVGISMYATAIDSSDLVGDSGETYNLGLSFFVINWVGVVAGWMIAGFFMFRALDILKPLGIRRLEALPGGWGIMLDDIGAGILGAVVLNAVRLAFFP